MSSPRFALKSLIKKKVRQSSSTESLITVTVLFMQKRKAFIVSEDGLKVRVKTLKGPLENTAPVETVDLAIDVLSRIPEWPQNIHIPVVHVKKEKVPAARQATEQTPLSQTQSSIDFDGSQSTPTAQGVESPEESQQKVNQLHSLLSRSLSTKDGKLLHRMMELSYPMETPVVSAFSKLVQNPRVAAACLRGTQLSEGPYAEAAAAELTRVERDREAEIVIHYLCEEGVKLLPRGELDYLNRHCSPSCAEAPGTQEPGPYRVRELGVYDGGILFAMNANARENAHSQALMAAFEASRDAGSEEIPIRIFACVVGCALAGVKHPYTKWLVKKANEHFKESFTDEGKNWYQRKRICYVLFCILVLMILAGDDIAIISAHSSSSDLGVGINLAVQPRNMTRMDEAAKASFFIIYSKDERDKYSVRADVKMVERDWLIDRSATIKIKDNRACNRAFKMAAGLPSDVTCVTLQRHKYTNEWRLFSRKAERTAVLREKFGRVEINEKAPPAGLDFGASAGEGNEESSGESASASGRVIVAM